MFIGSCRVRADTEQRQLATDAGFNMPFLKKILAKPSSHRGVCWCCNPVGIYVASLCNIIVDPCGAGW